MPILFTTYGLDPGLRHGSLVEATWRANQPDLALVSWKENFSWTQRDSISLCERSSPDEITQLGISLVEAMSFQEALGIDWDENSVFWGSRKLQAIKLAFFLGWLRSQIPTCYYWRPISIYKHFGVSPQGHGRKKEAAKREVQRIFASRILWSSMERPRGDTMDALILAYMTARLLIGEL